jgi:hypothetical protein
MSLRETTSNEDLQDFINKYIDAIIATLDKYNRVDEKGLRLYVNNILDDDSLEVGKFPIIGVQFDGHDEEVVSMGSQARKYKLSLRANIWYYQEKISPSPKKRELLKALSQIASIIRANPTLGGYAINTNSKGSVIFPRIRQDTIISAGAIIIEAEKIIRQNLI